MSKLAWKWGDSADLMKKMSPKRHFKFLNISKVNTLVVHGSQKCPVHIRLEFAVDCSEDSVTSSSPAPPQLFITFAHTGTAVGVGSTPSQQYSVPHVLLCYVLQRRRFHFLVDVSSNPQQHPVSSQPTPAVCTYDTVALRSQRSRRCLDLCGHTTSSRVAVKLPRTGLLKKNTHTQTSCCSFLWVSLFRKMEVFIIFIKYHISTWFQPQSCISA